MGLRAARTPSHLVAPPPPQPPSFLITAAISSMAPAQHVTSLPWGGCAGGGGAGVSGEKRRTGGWARWKIPLLSPPRPQRRAFIRGYPPGGPDSILRPPLCHQRMERWRFVRPPLPSLLPRTAAMCEQRPGSSAAVPEGGGLCAPLDPPPRKAAPGGAGTAARRSCGAQGCGVRRTRVRLSVLPPRASRRASAPGFSMAPRPRPPPPPTKRSALTSPNPPPPLLIPLIPSGAVAACWLPAP